MSLPNNAILDLLISLGLIYALLSIFVSIIIEWWNYKTKTRGKHLKSSIIKLLSDPFNADFGYLFFSHPMISGLKKDEKSMPQYISGQMFSETLIDIVAKINANNRKIILPEGSGDQAKTYAPGSADAQVENNIMDQFRDSVQQMNESPFKDMMWSFYHKSAGNYDNMKTMTSKWYDDYMDRVSGWYKANQRKKYWITAFFVSVLLNVDSIHIIKVLSLDDNLKTILVEQAEGISEEYSKNIKTVSDQTSDNYIKLFDSIKKTIKSDSNRLVSEGDTISTNVLAMMKANDTLRKYLSRLNDSITDLSTQKTDSLLDYMSDLNIPLGWNSDEAPLSWFAKGCVDKHKDSTSLSGSNSKLISYITNRNSDHHSFKNWAYYLAGLFFSTLALSFGAPFWFEMLAKFINIRKSGIKPKT